MENRKQAEVECIIKYVKDYWQLSINEDDTLESFLTVLLDRDEERLKQVSYLLNDEINSLLGKLNDREVIEYCSEELGMISSDDEDDLIKALDDLKYNWIDKVDEEEMISALEDCGYTIDSDNYLPQNIVEESQFEEWAELFNQLTIQQRELYINQIRGVYER